MEKLSKKLFGYLVLVLPLCLFFSYYPVIGLGTNESMNFELSIPLIWLVVFDLVGGARLIHDGKLFNGLFRKLPWLLFPIWVTLTIIWSLNVTRGVLTAGIMWLIYLAGYAMWKYRSEFNEEFKRRFIKWFMWSTLFVCGWCVLQCILDLAGVSREYSLMCEGCIYRMFGFPHPNGFAIEPQFMGNLLLAPAILAAYLLLVGHGGMFRSNCLSACFFIVTATLFLTFSRGAIYAFVVGLCFMSAFVLVAVSKKRRGKLTKRVLAMWGTVILSFLFTLNLQGIMAAVSPTDDTYFDGVAKVVNQLTLGVIDLKGDRGNAQTDDGTDVTREKELENESVVVEKVVEKVKEGTREDTEKEEAIFDGYVEESTNTRLKLSGAALEVWSKNPANMMAGVGLGGAGQALYNNGLSSAPKEIIQNEYFSLLLETGAIGISLFVLTVVLLIRVVLRSGRGSVIILSLMVAYGVSLCFFSGFANALQVYLLIITAASLFGNDRAVAP